MPIASAPAGLHTGTRGGKPGPAGPPTVGAARDRPAPRYHRSRATVIADTAMAPASSSTVAHAASVAPVVRTSSTSTIHGARRTGTISRSRENLPRVGAGGTPRDVAGAGNPIEVELGGGDPAPLQQVVTDREAEATAGNSGDEGRLVVPALADPVARRGDRHEHVSGRARARPATGHGETQRAGHAAIAGVLEPVECPPRDARERRAPFDLDEWRRDVARAARSAHRPARRGGRRAPERSPRRAAGPSRSQPAQSAGRARSRARSAADANQSREAFDRSPSHGAWPARLMRPSRRDHLRAAATARAWRRLLPGASVTRTRADLPSGPDAPEGTTASEHAAARSPRGSGSRS